MIDRIQMEEARRVLEELGPDKLEELGYVCVKTDVSRRQCSKAWHAVFNELYRDIKGNPSAASGKELVVNHIRWMRRRIHSLEKVIEGTALPFVDSYRKLMPEMEDHFDADEEEARDERERVDAVERKLRDALEAK